MLSPVLCAFHCAILFIPRIISGGRDYCCSHFTDEETEAKGSCVTCCRPQRPEAAEQGLQ